MSLIKIIPTTTSSLPYYHKPAAAGSTKSSHLIHVHGRRSTLAAAVTTTDYSYYSDLLLIRRRFFKCNKRTRTGMIMCMPADDESGDPEGGLEHDDKLQQSSSRATETTSIGNKLFTAPRNNKHILNDLSDIITNGCRYLYSFLFNKNGQAPRVMEIMSSYIKRNLRSTKIEIHVQTSSLLPEYGISIAVTWTLEWKENSIPLMKGMSTVYTCRVYPSKLVITRNVNADEMISTQPIWLLLLLLKPIIKQRVVDYAMGSKAPSLVHIFLAVTTTTLLLLLLVSYVFF